MAKGGVINCRFCRETFSHQRHLENHLKDEKKCTGMRDALFICMKCSSFCTPRYADLQSHLVLCQEQAVVPVEVIEGYQAQILELEAKIELYERSAKSNPVPSLCREPDAPDDRDAKAEVHQETGKDECLDEIFGVCEITDPVEHSMQLYRALHDTKRYTQELRRLKLFRRTVFRNGDLDTYTDLIKSNLKCLTELFAKKGFSKKKALKQTKHHFTALDMRLGENGGSRKPDS